MFPANSPAAAPTKVKLFGYLTARIDNSTVAILDDRIQLSPGGHVEIRDASGDKASTFADLATGQLVQAEGIWLGRHQFSAEKISVELGFLDKNIHETVYLQGEPVDVPKILGSDPAELKADGEWLMIGPKTRRHWSTQEAAQGSETISQTGDTSAPPSQRYAGHQVRYSGIRREDGRIETDLVELHPLVQRRLHPSPAGRALLDPDHPAAAASGRPRPADDPQEVVGRRGHRENLLLAAAQSTPANDAVFVVIIDGQEDSLVHGGLQQSWPKGRIP